MLIKFLGPFTDETVEDFWRMVWQENVNTIVILTNLEENGVVSLSLSLSPLSLSPLSLSLSLSLCVLQNRLELNLKLQYYLY